MKIRFKDYVKVGTGLGFGLCLGKTIYNFTGDVAASFVLHTLHRFVEADLIKDEKIASIVNTYYDEMHPEKKKEAESEQSED